MKTYYSKSLSATFGRQASFLAKNDELVARAAQATAALCAMPARTHCPLCAGTAPQAQDFVHRGAAYFRCPRCGHIVSCNDPSFLEQDEEQFAKVYPALRGEEREARRLNVYQPKLDWVLESCRRELGRDRQHMLAGQWLEIGCGEGFFLEALQRSGAEHVSGVEADTIMAGRCAGLLGADCVDVSHRPLACEIRERRFDVLAAWYVLEHVPDLHSVAQALASVPAGTLFCFAVPMFSLSVVLESACHGHFARTLDNDIHTQLFTDDSIDYFLHSAGFEKVSHWVFGQDVIDLGRIIRNGIAGSYSEDMAAGVCSMLSEAYEELQGVVDRHLMSDSRHVLAVKR